MAQITINEGLAFKTLKKRHEAARIRELVC